MTFPVIQNHEQQRNGDFCSSEYPSAQFALRQRSLEVSWGRRTKPISSRFYNYDSLDCLEPYVQSPNIMKVRRTAALCDDIICKERGTLVTSLHAVPVTMHPQHRFAFLM